MSSDNLESITLSSCILETEKSDAGSLNAQTQAQSSPETNEHCQVDNIPDIKNTSLVNPATNNPG